MVSGSSRFESLPEVFQYTAKALMSSKSENQQPCKLYDNEYKITSTQITNTEIFAFIAVLVFKLLSRKVFVYRQKRQKKLLKSRLLFEENSKFYGQITTKL